MAAVLADLDGGIAVLELYSDGPGLVGESVVCGCLGLLEGVLRSLGEAAENCFALFVGSDGAVHRTVLVIECKLCAGESFFALISFEDLEAGGIDDVLAHFLGIGIGDLSLGGLSRRHGHFNSVVILTGLVDHQIVTVALSGIDIFDHTVATGGQIGNGVFPGSLRGYNRKLYFFYNFLFLFNGEIKAAHIFAVGLDFAVGAEVLCNGKAPGGGDKRIGNGRAVCFRCAFTVQTGGKERPVFGIIKGDLILRDGHTV